jgi:hypothetical protein
MILMGYQDTSRQAYEKTKPQLNAKQIIIRNFLKRHYPKDYTNAEIAFEIGYTINRITPRTGELVKLGEIERLPARECNRTGNNARPLRYIKSIQEIYR